MRDLGVLKEEGSTRFRKGLTWRSALALVIASAIFLPINTLLLMISGTTTASASVYILAILFVELSSLMGTPMTKQEIFIVYMMAGMAGGTPVFLNYVYNSYFARSFVTWSFIDPHTGRPIPEVIPEWWAPRYDSTAYLVRSFFHPDWVLPMLVATIQFGVIWIIQEVALAMINSRIFLEAEELAFPLAEVGAQLAITLTEREEKRMHYFTISAFVGAVYGALVFGVPVLTLGMYNIPMQLIPIPWFDLTTGLFGIEQIMPGAAFGVATDPLSWLTGFLLPLNLLTYMLVGSLATWMFGNWLALTSFKDVFPLWASEWSRGMNLTLVWQRSYLRIWAFPQVSFLLSLAVFTIALHYKTFKSIFKPPVSFKTRKSEFPSLKWLLLMYLVASGCSVIFFNILVPDFPIWIAASTIGLGLIFSIAGTRARGETGQLMPLPYVWQGLILLSGYPAVDAWFISPTIGGSSAPLWVEGVKTAYLTETKPIDLFKAYILTVVLYHVFGFIYVSFFWAMAPIPSSQYPYTLISWPIQAISQGVWVSRQITANPDIMAYSFLGMTSIGILGHLLTKFVRIPFNFVGLVTGTTIVPPYTVSMFLGGLIGHYVFERYMGKENWDAYRAVIVAGVATGTGIVAGIAGAIVCIYKSIWILPF